MRVDLKRVFRVFRKLLAAGGIAAMALAAGTGTTRAALMISNGSFESPSVGNGYGSYFNTGSGSGVTSWTAHNMLPFGGYNNGDLNLMSNALLSTGGKVTGSQYVLAMRQGDPFPVFSGGVGNSPSGLYIDQQVGTLDATDLTQSFSLSADLIRAMGSWWGPVPTWAGAGVTIGFVDAATGTILAQKTISYTQSYASSNTTTPFIATDSVTWNAAGSGLSAGTPINVFVGFRVNPGLNNGVDYNAVAVDNLVLANSAATSYANLTWTGSDPAQPTQWSTAANVHNWSNGGTAAGYTEGALVTFDDSVGTGSTTVNISSADVNPAGVIFGNNASSYTLQGSHAVAGGAYVTVSGGGLVTILNNNTYTGGTNIANGTLQVGNGGNSGSLGPGDIVTNGSLVYARSDSVTTFSTITGDGSVTQQGPGLLILAGINAYTGATNVTGGTLQIGNGDAVTLASASINLSNSGVIAFDHSTTATYGGSITGNGAVAKSGAGILTLNGFNSYTGGTIINGGGLVFQSSAIPASGAIVVNNGATLLCAAGAYPQAGQILVNAGGAVNASALGAYDPASWLSSNAINPASAGALALAGSNAETLDFTQNGGYNSLSLGSIGNNTFSGTIVPGTGGYRFGGGGGILTVAVNLDGATTGAVISGPGTVVFNGVNTYGGGTVVSSGILDAKATASLPGYNVSGSLSVGSGATLSVSAGGTNEFGGNDIVALLGANGGNFSAGSSFGIDTSDASAPVTIAANIVAPVTLSKLGTGVLVLSGTNGYTGGTTVSAGALTFLTRSAQPSSGTISVAAGAALGLGVGSSAGFYGSADLDALFAGTMPHVVNDPNSAVGIDTTAGNFTYASGIPATTLGLIKLGANTLILTGSNAYTGGTTIAAGTLQIGNGGASGSVAGNIVNNGTLAVDRADTVMLAGVVSGSGNLVQAGNGALALLSQNTYTGSTIVSGGTLQVGNGGTTGSLGAGPVITNATLAFDRSDSNLIPLSVAISGSGGVVQQGTGIISIGLPAVSLNPCNNTSQSVYVAGSTGVYTSDGNWNSPIILPAAGTQPAGAVFMVRADSGYATSVATANTDLGSALGLAGGYSNQAALFRWNGTTWNFLGTETLTTNSQAAVANSYSGPTTVNAGTLVLLTPNSLSPTAIATVAQGATLDLGVGDQAVGSLSGGGNVSTLAFTLTIGGDNSNQTFSGVIAGSGGIVKTGGGTETLAGANTYTGTTAVDAGVLDIQGSLNGGPVTVNGGTLLLDYSVSNTSKIGGAALTLAGGTVALSGGSTTEVVGSTLLTAPTTVARPSGSSVLQLGTISPAGGTINFTAGGIAGADSKNTDGILGAWATVGGTDWATNSTNTSNGLISAYTGYTNVPLGGVIANSGTANIRLTGGASGNITLGATRTTVNTILQNQTSPTTIALASETLCLGAAGGVLLPAGDGSLTIGAAAGGGTLTAGGAANTAGQLYFTNNDPSAVLTVNSVIANNSTGAVSLTKAGPGILVLNGANSYSGATTVFGGTLQGSVSAIPGAVSLQNGANVAYNQVSAGTLNSVVSGSGSLIKSGPGLLTVTQGLAYSGATYITGGTLQVAPTAVSTGMYEGLVSGSNGFDTADPIPQTSIQPLARWGASTTSGGNNVYPAWGDNTTWGYSGFLVNSSGGTVTYNFGKNFDDGGYLKIDNTVVVDDNTWSDNTVASITLGPGVHSFDLRFGQGGGLVGPNGTGGNNGGPAYNAYGIAFNTTGNTAETGTWFQMGDSTDSPNTAFLLPTTGLSTTGSVVMSSNTTLDLSGTSVIASTIGSLADAVAGASSGQQVLLGGNILFAGGDNTSTTFSGNISGVGGSLTKVGSGAFTLAGSNSYTGVTTVQGGVLRAGSSTALPPSTSLTVDAGAALDLQGFTVSASGLAVSGGTVLANGGVLNVSGDVNLTSAVLFGGSGTLNATGVMNLNGGTSTISNGAVHIASDAWFQQTGALIIPTGASVTVGGTFYLTPPDGNTLGATYITGGTLTVAGNAQDARDSYYQVYQSGGVVTLGALLANQTYGGNNTGGSAYTSWYNLTGGLLTVGNIAGGNATAWSRAISLNLGGGTLAASQSFVMNANVINLTGINGNTTIDPNGYVISVPNAMTGDGGLVVAGGGTLALAGTSSYSGGTTLLAGTLQLGNSSALGSGGLTLDGGELDMNGNSISVYSLSGAGGTISDESSPPTATPTMLTVFQNTTTSFGGAIRDGLNGQSVALTMSGPGTLILSGSNSYSGGTFADNGILGVTTASALPAGGSLAIGAGGTFVFDPTLAGGAVAGQSQAAAGVAAVPEPSTLLLLGVAGILAAAAVWRKKLNW